MISDLGAQLGLNQLRNTSKLNMVLKNEYLIVDFNFVKGDWHYV
jgi:hypothetical protein